MQLLIGIQTEHLNGRSGNRRPADYHDALAIEVFRPCVTPGMKQFRQCPCLQIISSDIAPLVQIAVDAGKGEIVQIIRSAVLSRKNVLDVECGQW